MQPYFFPYIGYFQAISAVDKYILYSNLNFIKEAWMNRNRLLMRDGNTVMTTVPLKNKSSWYEEKQYRTYMEDLGNIRDHSTASVHRGGAVQFHV